MSTDRREFLGSMLGVGMVALVGKTGRREDGISLPSSPWDVSWADKITGKHRAVFDSVEISEALGLIRALIWIKDNNEVYNTTPSDTNAVVVLRHHAIWLVMDDDFWAHHKIGEMTKITDPATKQPITRNPVIGSNPFGFPPALADDSLKRVMANGTVLACNLAFSLVVVPKIAADLKLDDAKARELGLQHIVPGVILQPSGVFATLRAQEAGCHYLLATDA